jgi:hypothetical protein
MFDAVSFALTMGFLIYTGARLPGANPMTLKSSFLAIALVLASASLTLAQSASSNNDASSLAPPEHPATESQVREYLTLTRSVEAAHSAMTEMIKSSRATSAPYLTASFWDDMEKAVLEIDLVGPCIPAYQKYFSQEDMAATIAFYKSPAGKRLLEAQPFIMSAASDVARKAGQQVGAQVALKHKDEIERLMKQSQPAQIVLPPDK